MDHSNDSFVYIRQLEASNALLREENEQLKDSQKFLHGERMEWMKKTQELRAALRKYGRHTNQCGFGEKNGPCVCGLDQALSGEGKETPGL